MAGPLGNYASGAHAETRDYAAGREYGVREIVHRDDRHVVREYDIVRVSV